MKRLISLLLFLTLCCAVQASARMNAYIAGSVASTASSTKQQEQTTVSDTDVMFGSEDRLYCSMSFKASGDYYMTSYKVRLYREGDCTGDIKGYLYAADAAGLPTGSAVASSTGTYEKQACGTLTDNTAGDLYEWTFTAYQLESGKDYAIVLYKSTWDAAKRVRNKLSLISGESIGKSADGSSWTSITGFYQGVFEIWGY